MEFSELMEKLFSILAIVGLLGAFFFLQKLGITSGGCVRPDRFQARDACPLPKKKEDKNSKK